MKPIYKFLSMTMLFFVMTLISCDGEKDLVVIEGNLPIKTGTLYMVGDATPSGWNIDAPTALSPSEDDPLVFSYEGPLNSGEFKCPLKTGNWGGVFVMPVTNGCKISKTGIEVNTFSLMPTGQPDNKWKVVDAGTYKITFDLRNWAVSATYLGE
jgi:hypothetical protein